MKRITFEGNFCDIAMCQETPGDSFCENGSCSQRQVWERLKYYENLEEQGRLVVLPCMVGDKVYSKDGKAAEIEEFYIEKHGISAMVSFQCDYNCEDCAFDSWHTEYSGENSCDGEYGTAMVPVNQFGKTVFLSHDEAEATLAAKEASNGIN